MLQRIEEIRDYLYKYIESRIDLFKIETQEKVENAAVQIIYITVLMSFISCAIIFVLTLIAALLNHWLESRYAGFLIMLALTTLSVIVWIWKRHWFEQIIRRIFYKMMRK